VPTLGVPISTALDFLSAETKRIAPSGFRIDYAGPSRQYVKEGSSLILTFFFSVIIIYLVLAAQFESFRDPIIVLVSVPLSIVTFN
jgi:multidrug efflux pump